LGVLERLVDDGNTVVVIEHNLDVVKSADWIIDLGPEGGDLGGRVVAAGAPERIARIPDSFTGEYVARALTGEAPASNLTAGSPQKSAARRRG
jgi:excinuclease ABC subunit A